MILFSISHHPWQHNLPSPTSHSGESLIKLLKLIIKLYAVFLFNKLLKIDNSRRGRTSII
jgi:hypothetical protein